MGGPSVSAPVLARLGASLRALGYDSQHLRLRLGRIPDRLTASVLVGAEHRASDDPLGSAIRFWCLGLPAASSEPGAALGGVDVAELEAAGLVQRAADGTVSASVRITPALGRLFVHDFDRGESLPREHVLGVNPSTRVLAGLTPGTRVERALDIGTGCGAHALRLVEHAQTVVATDISERAAWAARASAALNDIDGVDVRVGDGLEPVAGERFDLIVSNPPFVVSPASEMTFRDAATRGDALSRALVRDVVSYLRPGGVACVLVNWIVRAGESMTAAAEDWLADLPVRALVLQHDALDPPSYAQRWPLLPVSASLEEHRVTVDRWISELVRLEAKFVASGALILERTEGPSRVRVVRMPRRPSAGGRQVRRMLDAIGRFSGPDELALGKTHFRLVHGHYIDQRLHYGHGSYDAAPARMRLDESAGVVASIPAELLEAVFELDGERVIGDIAAEVSAGRGRTAAELEAALRPVVLELFETGFVEIADAS